MEHYSGIVDHLGKCVAVEVTNINQARIADRARACIVVCGPRENGISRMPDPFLIEKIRRLVSVAVFAKVRVGHTVEAEILDSIGVDYIDESEIEGIADPNNFIDKRNLRAALVCGCRDLGEALRRVKEGAMMLRAQGDSSGSGDIVETVRSVRKLKGEIRALVNMDEAEVSAFAERIKAPYDTVSETRRNGKLPAVVFASGGITSPADVALMIKLGCDGVFVGNEIFGFPKAFRRLRGLVKAVVLDADGDNVYELRQLQRGFFD